jgi:hypothetical protein
MQMVVACSLFVGCGSWDAKGREGKGLKEERGGVERSCGFVD